MNYESHFLKHLPEQPYLNLHIKRIRQKDSAGIPVLMIHGMVENGRIFYHESGKGLGSYLSQRGYDVYVADLRGIGLSEPKISRYSKHGQTETVCEDIPALIEFVQKTSGQQRLHIVAHSWGGIFLNAALARRPDLIPDIISGVYFGSKRTVRAKNIDRLIKIDLMWNYVANAVGKTMGYVDAVALRFGSDNETYKTNRQCIEWVQRDHWVDSDDGFDYHEALNQHELPPIWYLAAIDDHSLGHRDDVKRFMLESGNHKYRYTILSKKNGNAQDYDHINMLTSPKAMHDHFPMVLKWLERHEDALEKAA